MTSTSLFGHVIETEIQILLRCKKKLTHLKTYGRLRVLKIPVEEKLSSENLKLEGTILTRKNCIPP